MEDSGCEISGGIGACLLAVVRDGLAFARQTIINSRFVGRLGRFVVGGRDDVPTQRVRRHRPHHQLGSRRTKSLLENLPDRRDALPLYGADLVAPLRDESK